MWLIMWRFENKIKQIVILPINLSRLSVENPKKTFCFVYYFLFLFKKINRHFCLPDCLMLNIFHYSSYLFKIWISSGTQG